MKAYARAGLALAAASGIVLAAAGCEPDDINDPTAVSTVTVNAPTPSGKDSAASPPSKGSYVALGDSYTAGPGIPDQTGTPAGCDRSGHNYPSWVARQLDVKSSEFRDMSCSGATINDLSGPQSTDDGVNPAQLSALSASTELVTIGIGGNDIGFSSLVTRCAKAGVFYYAAGSGK